MAPPVAQRLAIAAGKIGDLKRKAKSDIKKAQAMIQQREADIRNCDKRLRKIDDATKSLSRKYGKATDEELERLLEPMELGLISRPDVPKKITKDDPTAKSTASSERYPSPAANNVPPKDLVDDHTALLPDAQKPRIPSRKPSPHPEIAPDSKKRDRATADLDLPTNRTWEEEKASPSHLPGLECVVFHPTKSAYVELQCPKCGGNATTGRQNPRLRYLIGPKGVYDHVKQYHSDLEMSRTPLEVMDWAAVRTFTEEEAEMLMTGEGELVKKKHVAKPKDDGDVKEEEPVRKRQKKKAKKVEIDLKLEPDSESSELPEGE